MKTKTKVLLTLGVILLVFVLFTINGMFYVVSEDEHACVMRFTQVIDQKSNAGIYIKVPFIDEVKTYPKNVLVFDINPSTVLLKDKMNMVIDSYVLWQIDDPLLFHKTLGSVNEAQTRLDVLTYNETQKKFGVLQREDIVNTDPPEERNDIYNSIRETVNEGAKAYGITVFDVKVKKIDLPEENENEVFKNMISEREQIAELYRAQGELAASRIKNEADKDYNLKISEARLNAEKAIAEGERIYMETLAEAYNSEERIELYKFMRSLQALEASFTGESKTIILGADSELAKILLGPQLNG
ncbi:protease modulator HflC [Eubacteriales bacterium OttesenSCG-928-G02]|nr:protease modulator HflC [Eubacteriales bacterium OttesenSCG-928-G02]